MLFRRGDNNEGGNYSYIFSTKIEPSFVGLNHLELGTMGAEILVHFKNYSVDVRVCEIKDRKHKR